MNVKEVNPLKQGLKLFIKSLYKSGAFNVKEVNPLKQGLKPYKPGKCFVLSLWLKK